MTFEMTMKEAHALTTFIALIRDRCGGPVWHKTGIEDALARARTLAPAPDLAIAAIRAAREPSNRTPAVIGMEGPHWQGSATPPRRPYEGAKTCATCGFAEAVCRARWAEDHAFESVEAAKARKLTHGLDTRRAAEALKQLATEPPERPAAAKSTKGTERVAPIRADLREQTQPTTEETA